MVALVGPRGVLGVLEFLFMEKQFAVFVVGKMFVCCFL
jgi:hypothetical protein